MLFYKNNNIISTLFDTTDTTNQPHLNGGWLVHERMDEPVPKKTCTSWAYSSSIGTDSSPKKRIKLDTTMEKQNSSIPQVSHVQPIPHVHHTPPVHYVQQPETDTCVCTTEVDYCQQIKQMEEDTKEDKTRVLKCLFVAGLANDFLALEIVHQAKMWYGKLTNRELVDLVRLYKKVKSRQTGRFPSTKKMIGTCIRRPQRKSPLRHPYIL